MRTQKGTFRDLIVWQKGVDLCAMVYQATRTMPDTEKFGLVSQMRRAVVSVPSNIAEGNARQSIPEYIHFLTIARGSLAELETQVIIASRLKLISDPKKLLEAAQEVRRILQGLIGSLRRRK